MRYISLAAVITAFFAIPLTTDARGGGGCFLRGTPIKMADGTERPIESIQSGDRLLSYDPETESFKESEVISLSKREADEFLNITIGEVQFGVTPEHPFYSHLDRSFIEIGSFPTQKPLSVYDRGGLKDQTISKVEKVRHSTDVFNLTTSWPHTYFAHEILVHNKGGGCFLAGTMIRMADSSTKLIEEVQVGDVVLSYDPIEDRYLQSTVTEVTRHQREKYLKIYHGNSLSRATAEHPFFVETNERKKIFKEIGDFRIGDPLTKMSSNGLVRESIDSVEEILEPAEVFNLSTTWPHTFFADDILVHNKGGGGGGFHGGGRSYHSSRSGSSGQADFEPVTLIVMVGFIALVFFIARSKGLNQNLDHNFSRAEIEKKSSKTSRLAEFISKTDETFQPEALRSLAKKIFLEVQRNWEARDYRSMESSLMPDLYRQHCAQLEGMKRNHEINRMEGLTVLSVDLVNIRYPHKKTQREFSALITARAKDYYVDDRSLSFMRGDSSASTFQEFYTFQMTEEGWRLREIEQTKESSCLRDENFFEPFTDQGVKQIYGEAANQVGPVGPSLQGASSQKLQRVERLLNFLYETDKLWDRDAMLSRVRSTFMDLLLAQESQDASKLPVDRLYPAIASELRRQINERKDRVEFRNLCVRKAEIVLVRNFNDRSKDEFTARILAHAQLIITRNGSIIQKQDDVTPFTSFWVFGRLDNQWKLKDILPPARGENAMASENIDEGSSKQMLEWFYSKSRAA